MAARKKTKKKSRKKPEPKGTLEITKEEPKKPWMWVIAIATIVLLVYTFTGSDDVALLEEPAISIQEGDLVKLKFIGKLEDGTIFDTNYKELADELGFTVPSETLNFVVGAQGDLMGLHESVVGMQVGQEATFTIPSSKAYGEYDPLFLLQWPQNIERRNRAIIGRFLSVPKSEIAKVFNIDVVDQEFEQGEKFYSQDYNVDYVVQGITDTGNVLLTIDVEEEETITLPNTPWNSSVWYVNETVIIVRQQPQLGQEVQLQWGTYSVSSIEDHHYVLTSNAQPGDQFAANGRYGSVRSVEDGVVYFDANHPLAGKDLEFTVEIIDIQRSS